MKRPLLFCLILFFFLTLLNVPPRVFSEDVAGPLPGDSLPIDDLSVPEELGKIQERFSAPPGAAAARMIIQVQDVHAHATAQENIAAILERLRTMFGIKTVALEGAWITTSLPKSQAIPTSREKRLLASSLLSDDLISGPAYAAIMSREPIELAGIEDAGLYQKNRELFLAHLGRSKETAEKITAYGQSIRDAERAAWGPELLAFGTAFGKFRESGDLGQFFPLLVKTAEARAIEFQDLGQIVLLRDITALEKSFTKEKLQQQIGQLMRQYKGAPWTVEELIRGGKVSPEKLGMYPEIVKMKNLFEMRDKVSLRDLTGQINTLTGRVLGKFVTSPDQDALWQKAERFYLARRVLSLQATPADLADFEKQRAAIETELAGAGLSQDLALALEFYDVVKQRDQIFFDKIMNDSALAGNIAVVTGGFHTDGLSERFRKAGVSYVTIAPELGGERANEKLYAERMQDPLGRAPSLPKPERGHEKIVDQTLAEPKNEQLIQIEDFFPLSVDRLKETKNLNKSRDAFLGGTPEVPASGRIARLAGEGRIKPAQGRDTVNISPLRESEFMAKPRAEQRKIVRGWLEQANNAETKAMLVSSVGVLKPMSEDPRNARIIEQNRKNGDIFALLQDVPAAETPEALLTGRGIERFEVKDIDALITGTARFQKFAKTHPFVIMKEGYQSGRFVVLPENPVSLVLYRIITLNSSIYRAARNPEFLELLQFLVTEILSQELPKKSV